MTGVVILYGAGGGRRGNGVEVFWGDPRGAVLGFSVYLSGGEVEGDGGGVGGRGQEEES